MLARLSLRVVPTAAVVAAACLCAPAAAAAASPATTTDPARAAAGWLAQQFTDHLNYPGYTSFDGGATADAVFALASARSGRSQIDRTMRYFAAHVDEYTNLQDTTGKPGPYDGSVGKTAVAAMVTGLDPRAFGGRNLLTALHADQCVKVSAPKNDKDYSTPTCPAVGAARNIFSSVSESFAVLAQARAAGQYGATYAPDAAALHYFYSLQCPDGGFTVQTSTASGCTADIDSTAYALMALEALHTAPGKAAAAARWLSRQQQQAGYWISQGGPNVDSTGLAAAALDGAGVDAAAARSWLATQQVTTGPTLGTGAARGALQYEGRFDAGAAVKATSDGLLGMVRHGSLATLTDAHASPDTAVLALAAPTLSSARARRGQSVQVTGTGFSRGESVRILLGSARVKSAAAGAQGTVSARFTVPSSADLGRQPVTLTGARSGLSASAALVLRARQASSGPAPSAPPATPPAATPPAPTAGQPILAATGPGHLGALVGGGLGSFVLGGLALLAGRRRRA